MLALAIRYVCQTTFAGHVHVACMVRPAYSKEVTHETCPSYLRAPHNVFFHGSDLLHSAGRYDLCEKKRKKNACHVIFIFYLVCHLQ